MAAAPQSGHLTQVSKALDFIDAERFADAERICRQVLARAPAHPHALRALANALFLQRKEDAALHFARAAARAAPPGDAHFAYALARQMRQLATYADTWPLFRAAVDADPAHIDAWIGLTESHLWGERFTVARDAGREAASRVGPHPDAAMNLAVAILNLGHAEESLGVIRGVRDRFPEYSPALLFLAGCGHYAQSMPAAECFRAHCAAGQALHAQIPAEPVLAVPHDGPLRVGILSPDLRGHSVLYFIEPLLAHLDRARFELTAYMLSTATDAHTRRIMPLFARWRDIAMVETAGVDRQVRDDRIDILIDLAGHTAGGRPRLLARKPAPILVSFLGYPDTTGLNTVDYRVVDSLTDPAGDPYRSDALATERLARLDPCFLCYRPPASAPPVGPGPAGRGGPVTFGSFNALKKTSDWTLAWWGRILNRVPGSRLVLKNVSLDDPAVREDLLARLTAVGIERHRVDLLPRTAHITEHLACYAAMDVALDTFPYHGTTTTCEALHMGVPVVSLAGDRHAARVGLSLLIAVGLPELCAHTPEAWVEAAVALAGDLPRLGALRASLRERMAASVLCDEPRYAARFGEALEHMWAAALQGR